MNEYGLDPKQFCACVIRPVLDTLKLYSPAAEILLLGTALTESNLRYVRQIKGPAIGIYQMEPATHDDIWENFLRYKKSFAAMVANWMVPGIQGAAQMAGNTYYATAMARAHYARVKQALPSPSDYEALARYHKEHYNTALGATDITHSQKHFAFAVDTVLR